MKTFEKYGLIYENPLNHFSFEETYEKSKKGLNTWDTFSHIDYAFSEGRLRIGNKKVFFDKIESGEKWRDFPEELVRTTMLDTSFAGYYMDLVYLYQEVDHFIYDEKNAGVWEQLIPGYELRKVFDEEMLDSLLKETVAKVSQFVFDMNFHLEAIVDEFTKELVEEMKEKGMV